MPFQHATTEIQLKDITTRLTGAADTLKILSDSIDSAFLGAISNTTRSLLTMVEVNYSIDVTVSEADIPSQTVRQNKKDCAQLLEQTYTLLQAIIALHIKSETGGDLSPSMLDLLGRSTEFDSQYRPLFTIDHIFAEHFTRFILSLKYNRIGASSSNSSGRAKHGFC